MWIDRCTVGILRSAIIPTPTPSVLLPRLHLRLVMETFTSSRDSFCCSKTSFFSYSAANRSAASSRRVSSFTFTAMILHGAVEGNGGGARLSIEFCFVSLIKYTQHPTLVLHLQWGSRENCRRVPVPVGELSQRHSSTEACFLVHLHHITDAKKTMSSQASINMPQHNYTNSTISSSSTVSKTDLESTF